MKEVGIIGHFGFGFGLAIGQTFYLSLLVFQLVVYFLALLPKVGIKNKLIKFISYYCMTILAQAIGAYNMITGKSKPFWEKAESTR